MYAIIEPGSCFAGLLFELALAADRSYMLALPDEEGDSPKIAVDDFNFDLLPAVNDQSRLQTRFSSDARDMAAVIEAKGKLLGPGEALRLGLVTVAPDDLDWEDEVRVAIEERVSLSPDALTGMEASLRFPGDETLETKVFGRLVGVAELGVHPSQLHRRARRAQALRNGIEGAVYVGESVGTERASCALRYSPLRHHEEAFRPTRDLFDRRKAKS